jgi:NADH:ubiquinone oxidoreductase subunit F (NADH-binding)/(2Fe-2S) ferredoxin
MKKLKIGDLKQLRKKIRKAAHQKKEQSRARITVHMGTCGIAAGAQEVLDVLESEIKKQNLQNILVTTSGCAGLCSQEPMVTVELKGHPPLKYVAMNDKKIRLILNEHVINGKIVKKYALAIGSEGSTDIPQLDEEHPKKGKPVKKIIAEPLKEELPVQKMMDIGFFKHQRLIVLRNRGRLDPENIEEYIGFEGYQALEKALSEMKPDQIIEEIKTSGLRGRGGAGFPTGIKWELCRKSPGKSKYLICNGDEGDPGAFMDRSILEADPHAVIEGMLIGGLAVGAQEGFIYVRSEYPLAVKRIIIALDQAMEYGLLGKNILGTDFSFFLNIIQGAGAFVCGEETALMASIEGNVGRPRSRPPFPAEKGLWGCPTNINNVETWANVPRIILKGSDWFSSIGTETSKGTKIFSLVGKINNTGLVEVPMGITLRKIVEDVGGGIPGGKKFKGIQTGGPSGGCIPEKLLDLPIDYESLNKAGSIMGSGGMIVMDDDTCMVDVARYFLNFTVQESCGKCTPCRVGTRHMVEILNKITQGTAEMDDLKKLESLANTIKSTSLCGLGQTAPNPVLTTLKYFREEYESHIIKRYCPALVCRELIEYYVIEEKCTGCQRCVSVCPTGAITGPRAKPHNLDANKCIKCRACYEICRFDAIAGDAIVIRSGEAS